jgi:ankyrin repeat protein
LEVARYLIEEMKADAHLANGDDANGLTPFALAVMEGESRKEMVKLLLDLGGPLEDGIEDFSKVVNTLGSNDTVEIRVEVEQGPRYPVRLATKEQRDTRDEDSVLAVTLEASREDCQRWIANMQIRRPDLILASSDPKDRPLMA